MEGHDPPDLCLACMFCIPIHRDVLDSKTVSAEPRPKAWGSRIWDIRSRHRINWHAIRGTARNREVDLNQCELCSLFHLRWSRNRNHCHSLHFLEV